MRHLGIRKKWKRFWILPTNTYLQILDIFFYQKQPTAIVGNKK